jgi:hypothetical protein
MKTAKWMLPVTLMLLSGLMAAQSITSSTVVAQVPFDFMVNNKIMPAGDLAVRSATMDGRVLAVNNVAAHKSALANASAAEQRQPANRTILVFKRYGNQYFLSGIKIEGSTLTYTLPESRAEVELRAQYGPATDSTLLASLK